MYKTHREFNTPEYTHSRIWKYVDFTKLVSLLSRSELFFCRADKQGDQYEGSYPKANYKGKTLNDAFLKVQRRVERMKKHIFINSWNINEHESAAMWKMYLKSNEGIAVTSTFERLKNSLQKAKENVYIGNVRYHDYELLPISTHSLFLPFIHKLKSYEFENELRAIHYLKSKTTVENGMYIKIDFKLLIEKIYVAPNAENWFKELVVQVVKDYELSIEVIDSSLNDRNLI